MFEPWVGPKYNAGIGGHKVMILGESHWHDCQEDENCQDAESAAERHRTLTMATVEHWKDNPHSSPVSHAVPKLFGLQKAEFWESVVFYNYLQTFAGTGAKQRPTAEQWDAPDSAVAFQQVLDQFEPDRILVLGKQTWQNMPSNTELLHQAPLPEQRLRLRNNIGDHSPGDEVGYWYFTDKGKRALTMPIIHPAAVGFRTSDWTQSISDWMQMPGELRLGYLTVATMGYG